MATLAPHIQAAYANDPRRQQLAQMLAQGSSTAPVNSHLGGLARLVQAGVGGYQSGDLQQKYQDQNQRYGQGLEQALMAQTPHARQSAIAGMGSAGTPLAEAMVKARLAQDTKPAPAPQGPKVIGQGAALVGPDGKELYSRPAASKLKSPEEMAQAIKLRQAGRAQTDIHLPGTQKSEDKKMGEAFAKYYEDASTRAVAAEETLAQLHMMKAIDVTSGAAAPLKAWVSGMAEGLGVDPGVFGLESATNAQAFVGVAQNIVLGKMQSQKGPQTENDASRIERTISSLKNTPAAKEFLTDAAIAVEERAIEQRDFLEAYYEEKGTMRGASKAWTDFKRQTPMIGKNPDTGLPVFYNQFKRAVMRDNPGVERETLLGLWRKKYSANF